MSHDKKKALIVPWSPEFSLLRQAELLDISRSSLYYIPKDKKTIAEDKKLMDMIDVIYTDLPFYGS